jgi:hypothetical protein
MLHCGRIIRLWSGIAREPSARRRGPLKNRQAIAAYWALAVPAGDDTP